MLLHNTAQPVSELCLNPAGEILYKAWQNCSEKNKDYIEQDCIQELMNSAILARTSQLHANVERVLRCLHEQKVSPAVQEMLERLYKPILWPSLAAPNAHVRRNAVNILLSAFPISVRVCINCCVLSMRVRLVCFAERLPWNEQSQNVLNCKVTASQDPR